MRRAHFSPPRATAASGPSQRKSMSAGMSAIRVRRHSLCSNLLHPAARALSRSTDDASYAIIAAMKSARELHIIIAIQSRVG